MDSVSSGGTVALRNWIGVNVIDAFLVALAMAMGGAEGNPFLGFLASYIGNHAMLMVKLALATIIGSILWQRGRLRILIGLNYLMLLVIAYNVVALYYLFS